MMIGRDDDASLVELARAGDTAAFGSLVRRYQDRLFPTAYRLTGRVEDAQDLVQEAFLKAYVNLGQFHGESSFFTWLYRIAVNLALSNRRKKRVESHAPLAQGMPRDDLIEDPSRAGPSDAIERAERDQQIHRALGTLSPDHRVVVVMKDLDGLSYEEIARNLRIPLGTVRSRLHRARLELREKLRGFLEINLPRDGQAAEASGTTLCKDGE